MTDILKSPPVINRIHSSDIDRFAIQMFKDLFGVFPIKQNYELRDISSKKWPPLYMNFHNAFTEFYLLTLGYGRNTEQQKQTLARPIQQATINLADAMSAVYEQRLPAKKERRIIEGLHLDLLDTIITVTRTEMSSSPRRPRAEAGRQVRFRREVLAKNQFDT